MATILSPFFKNPKDLDQLIELVNPLLQLYIEGPKSLNFLERKNLRHSLKKFCVDVTSIEEVLPRDNARRLIQEIEQAYFAC